MDYTTLFIIALCGIALGLYLGGNNNRGRYRNPYDDPRSGGYPPYPPYPPYYPYYPPYSSPQEQYRKEPDNNGTDIWLILILITVVCFFVYRGNSNNTKQERATMPHGSSINIQPSNYSKQVTQPKRLQEKTVPGNNPKFYYQEAE